MVVDKVQLPHGRILCLCKNMYNKDETRPSIPLIPPWRNKSFKKSSMQS
jgi:hypothetical protein